MPTHTGKTIKLILADDHNIIRESIRNLLEEVPGFEVVGEASSGEQAVKLARKFKPDVALMDIKMPGIGGLEATRRLKLCSPKTKVVVLTSCEDEIFSQRFFKAGVFGYLTKVSGIAEIVKALQSASVGKRYITPDIASKLAINRVVGQAETPFETLSARELQICLMITRGDRVPEIAAQLNLSPKTVNSYRYRIFEKLGLMNDVGLTRLAMRYNLLEEDVVAGEKELTDEAEK